jgi:hypothetical protein
MRFIYAALLLMVLGLVHTTSMTLSNGAPLTLRRIAVGPQSAA